MGKRVVKIGLLVAALVLLTLWGASALRASAPTPSPQRPSRETVPSGVQLSPGAEFVAFEKGDETVLCFPVLGRGFKVHTWKSGLEQLALDFEGGMLAWREDGAVWVADLEKDGLIDVTRMATDLTEPYQPRVSPDGTRVAVAFQVAAGTDVLVVFDRSSGVELWRAESAAMFGSNRGIAWSPDCEVLVSVHAYWKNSPQLIVYDSTTGEQLAQVDGWSSNWQTPLLFLPETHMLWTRISHRGYTQGIGPPIDAFDLSDPAQPRKVVLADAPFYNGAVISTSGKLVAAVKPGVAGNVYTIWRYDGERFEEIATAPFIGERDSAVAAFSYGDKELVLAHRTGDVESYDIATGVVALQKARGRWW